MLANQEQVKLNHKEKHRPSAVGKKLIAALISIVNKLFPKKTEQSLDKYNKFPSTDADRLAGLTENYCRVVVSDGKNEAIFKSLDDYNRGKPPLSIKPASRFAGQIVTKILKPGEQY